jgi:hypothetical protein
MYYLVEFACYSEDEVKNYLLDENKHEDWCLCEPQVGYKHFKTIWRGEIEGFYEQNKDKNKDNAL